MREAYEEEFYRVSVPKHSSGPGLVAGVWVHQRTQKVADAAPILKWAVGKPADKLWAWVEKLNGTIERLDR